MPISCSGRSVITLTDVSKRYELGAPIEIRRLLARWRTRRARSAGSGDSHSEHRDALRNFTLTVQHGETLGVIGSNGAGKTTLLRLLAGVTLPTSGRVRVEGKIASLIGLGIGFHPDLTGRENVHLYCALMGFQRRDLRRRVDEILDFAEIGDYVDVAFKRYSSGMMARLGFAAAVSIDPGVLLLDEVLAVGDLAFYRKSEAALAALAARSTVILVAHNLHAIPEFCRRAIWIEQGRLMADGPAAAVVASYVDAQR